MQAKWFTSDSYHCDKCNMVRDAAKLIEERIDTETGNPIGVIELNCGHTQKIIRVSRQVDIAPLFRTTNKVIVESQVTSGTPSVLVSGGGLSILGGKLDLSNIHSNNFVMNVSTVNIHGNNAIVRQNSTITDVQASLSAIKQTIEKDLPNENERKEVLSILEDVKNDLRSKRIPHSHLNKLKKFERVYSMVLPWAMKAMDYVVQNGSLPL